jgi:hypothetical protein
MVGAVAKGTLDAALVWGPQAGYFAALATPPLELRGVRTSPEFEGGPFEFDIAMGVRPWRYRAAQRAEPPSSNGDAATSTRFSLRIRFHAPTRGAEVKP